MKRKIIKDILITTFLFIIIPSVLAASTTDKTYGDEDAPVTIEFFDDLQCPFCTRWYNQTFPLIKEDYIDEGKAKLVFRHFPLPFHPNAEIAARGAECAAEQSKFFDYIELVHNAQNPPNLSQEALEGYAKKLNLDMNEFDACFSDEDIKEIIEKDVERGSSLGVTGTPTFFINERKLIGAQPYESFRSLINELLEEGGDNSPSEPTLPEPEIPPIEVKPIPPEDMQQEPVIGEDDAKVHIVAYMGYNDPFSRIIWKTIDKLFDKFDEDISFEFRNFPLHFQDSGNVAAMAGECVLYIANEDIFFKFTEEIMSLESSKRVQKDDLIDYAEDVDVDIENCLQDIKFLPEVLDDIENGKNDNVSGTPTLFINKRRVIGAQPYSVFETVVKQELGQLPETEEPAGEIIIEVPPTEFGKRCREGEVKKYTCTDNTKINWCECIGERWVCILDPQILCPKQESECTTGCDFEGKCIPYGQRLQDKNGENVYCTIPGVLEIQKEEDTSCQNNYECLTNQCSNGQCIDITEKLEETTGLLQKILNLLKKIF